MKTPRMGCLGGWSAERQDRTVDTAIFSRVLYQLSYLGMRADFTIGREAVKKISKILMLNCYFSRSVIFWYYIKGMIIRLFHPFSFDNLPCEH